MRVIHSVLILVVFFLVPYSATAAVQILYAGPSVSGDEDCSSEEDLCTMTTALATVADGDNDVIVLTSGTYTTSLHLNDTTDHDNLTITTTDAVIAALGTFTRGIPDGVDNRPYIQGTDASERSASIADGVSGATIQYLRLRARTNPIADWAAIVNIYEYPATVQYCEFWNGRSGVGIRTSQQVTINHCYIHDIGVDGTDSHGIAVWNFQKDAAATGWEDKIYFANNTIIDAAGDGIQELGQYSSESQGQEIVTKYVEYYNNSINSSYEQGLDFKGTQYVKIHGNDILNNGYGGIGTNDSDGGVDYNHAYWYIYNNRIHGHDNYAIMSQEGDDSYFYIWNNLIYNNCNDPTYNYSALHAIPPNSVVEHNVIWDNTAEAGNNACGISSDYSVYIRNNILYNNGIGDYGNIYTSTPTTNIDTNYVYPTSPGITGSNAITDSNPYFNDTTTPPYDFHLVFANSTCDDAGLNLSDSGLYLIDTDYDDVSRDSTPNVGAYEEESSPSSTPTITGITITGVSIQ